MESQGDTDVANEWELCKENVQPLRQGRKFANLTAALQPNCADLQTKIRQEKQEFELELRTYTGDDPLDVWYRYIKWTEQTYPKGGCGKEGSLLELLENCVQKFKDEDVYRNDARYVDAWLKLANHQNEPLEIYNYMFNHGIGCMVSSFYSSWASMFEEAGNYKKADTIYQQGIRAGAHPTDHLKARHLEFQARVARQIAEDGMCPMETSETEPQRSTLAQLKGHGKHKKVGVDRMNISTKPAKGLGTAAPPKQVGGPAFSIFTEDSAPSAVAGSFPPQTAEYKSVPQRAKMKAENEQKPGKWSNAIKIKQKTVGTVPISEVSQRGQPTFPIHADEMACDPLATPKQPVGMDTNQVLSARKPQKQHNTLQAIQNPSMLANNPGEMPMYCKSKVYGGLHELQFEEVRAARWRKNHKRVEMEQKRLEEERKYAEERRAMIEMMEQQREIMEQQRSLLQQMQEKQRLEQMQQQPQIRQDGDDVNMIDVQLGERLQISDGHVMDEGVSMSQHNTSGQPPLANNPSESVLLKSNQRRQMFDDSAAEQQNMNQAPQSFTEHPEVIASRKSTSLPSEAMSVQSKDKSVLPTVRIFQDKTTSEAEPPQSGIKIFEDNPPGAKPIESGIKIFEENPPGAKPIQSGIKIFEENPPGAKPIQSGVKIFEENPPGAKPIQSGFKIFEENPPGAKPMQSGVKILEDHKPIECVDGKSDSSFKSERLEAGSRMLHDRRGVRPFKVQAQRQVMGHVLEQSIPEDEELVTTPNVSSMSAQTPGKRECSSTREPTPDSFYNPFRDSGGRSRENISAPSPTVNTKEALRLVMGMFNNTLDPGANFGWERDESIGDSHMEAEYADESEKPNVVAGGCIGTQNAQPFVIFDENQCASQPPTMQKPKEVQDELCDQENRAPSGYTNQPKRTALTGILQPSTDIPCQAKEDDSEDDDMFGIEPLPDADMTFAPCAESTKKFSHLAQMISTPFPNGGIVPLPNPALSNIHANRTQFDTKTRLDAEETMLVGKETEQQETARSTDAALFAKEDVYRLADQSPRDKFPRPSMGIGQLTPIMEGSSEKSSGHSDNSNNIFCHTGFSSHHPVTELETVDEESLRALSMNESRQKNFQTMGMNESRSVCNVSIPEISVPRPAAMNEAKKDVSVYEMTVPEISMPSMVVNESRRNVSVYEDIPDPDGPVESLGKMNETCHVIDLSTYVPDQDSGPDILSMSIAIDPSDPFDLELIDRFISRLPQPLSSHSDYHQCEGTMPKIRLGKSSCMVTLGLEEYEIVRKVGNGAFAEVYLANILSLDEATGFDWEGNDCVLKVQKPAFPWEFYICTELAQRLRRMNKMVDVTPLFMSIDKAYFYTNGCVFVNTYHKYGSLLNLVNAFKCQKMVLPESVVMYLTISLLKILENLMAVDIIHGDIKPDNFLLVGLPEVSAMSDADTILEKSFPIKLIDFGRSIDMRMFPAGTTFTAKVQTDGFQCIEMKTDRPWTYQTDFFGIVGVIHVLMFSSYMEVICQGTGNWTHSSRLRRNYKAVDLWTELKHSFLNIPNCDSMPDVRNIRLRFETYFKDHLFKNFEKDAKTVEMMLIRDH